MATVVDKSGNSRLDKPLSAPNRKNAGTPVNSLVPQYSGEMVLDTTNGTLYYATDLTTTGWAIASING